MPDILPQNIQALIGEIGEKQVLLRLAIMAHQKPGWDVFYNLGESGYDVLMMNMKRDERICIEVKTRQKMYSTAKNVGTVQFYLTALERSSSDFLVAYFMDHNDFYLVPTSDLKSVSGGKRWRFTINFLKSGQPSPTLKKYRNNWRSLHKDFKTISMRAVARE
ncbi:hypothetical protein ACFL6Q_03595 [Candidatus Neomarinimicrobiota bacterium]